MSTRGGERVTGPYYDEKRNTFRVVHYHSDGNAEASVFDTEAKAGVTRKSCSPT